VTLELEREVWWFGERFYFTPEITNKICQLHKKDSSSLLPFPEPLFPEHSWKAMKISFL
jgi:hypothetical protein